MHQNAGHGPEHRRQPMGTPIIDGAAQLQRHIRPRRNGEDNRGQREGQDDGKIGNEGRHGQVAVSLASMAFVMTRCSES
ncbi:hypothetical protein D3C71_2054980 [compost metagenome]